MPYHNLTRPNRANSREVRVGITSIVQSVFGQCVALAIEYADGMITTSLDLSEVDELMVLLAYYKQQIIERSTDED